MPRHGPSGDAVGGAGVLGSAVSGSAVSGGEVSGGEVSGGAGATGGAGEPGGAGAAGPKESTASRLGMPHRARPASTDRGSSTHASTAQPPIAVPCRTARATSSSRYARVPPGR
ncbi:hypothetical protein K701_09675 [Streptomyces fradiae ATCC 10745 = DSM 40063]|uniref:Uncharacterized protein n=1 Tax=Streptomyces fradiae ATCC 10745 = DSM 40063 TaxID=1319510 RepID=A0ABQ6XPT0_STRFR|nr:hypothetical protein K701_22085 [Streptomyces fradiae ATCC 10745 = DSM 40063]KAF0650048.1 hypothetical protein K701_09675 [Streptomyces fradiae ATCC 10745 = DSM 40063]